MAKRIVVVWHPNDSYDRTPYIIRVLIDEWRRRDIPVDVTIRLDQPTLTDENYRAVSAPLRLREILGDKGAN